MKIRSGFVSNSSSSSFVLVVTKEAFDEATTGVDPIYQAMLEAVMSKDTVFGHECMVYDDCSSEYWWESMDYGSVITRAKEIARAEFVPVTTSAEAPTDADELDEFLTEIIRNNMGEYGTKAFFKSTPKDQIWSHGMDW